MANDTGSQSSRSKLELPRSLCMVCNADERLSIVSGIQGRDCTQTKTSFSTSRTEIVRSASLGCDCCKLFQKGIEYVEREYGLAQEDARLEVECGRLKDSDVETREGFWMMLGFGSYPTGVIDERAKNADDRRGEVRLTFELYEPSGDAVPYLKGARSKRRDVPRQASDPACFHQLKLWLDVCDRQHCGSYGQRPSPPAGIDARPARLLHVETDSNNAVVKVKLVETPLQTHLCYTTLSYCWGDAKFVTLTKETYRSHYHDGILVNNLPRTYRDAIRVTHSIGVYYIWIDSLCIVQEDKNDWETEAAKMAAIYEGSYLTIAAGSASNPHAGFLNDRLIQGRFLTTLDVWSPGASSKINIHIREMIEHSDDTRLHPMMRRAWCLQELALSKRVILYNANELAWKCRRMSSCECGELNYGDRHPPIIVEERRETEGQELRKFGQKWLETAEKYSAMQLTEESDILPAIGGLASRMHYNKLGRYLAGLWEADIIHGLLWGLRDESMRRPSAYQAPSWSWASVIGPVYWDSGTKEGIPVASMLNTEVSRSNQSDTFGRVRHGFISLRGTLVKGKFEWKRYWPGPPFHVGSRRAYWGTRDQGWPFQWLRLDDGRVIKEVDLDNLYDGEDEKWDAVVGTSFYSLRMLTRPPGEHDDDKMMAYGLLLQKIEGKSGVYRRVGWHGASRNKVYEDVEEQELKII